MDQSTVPWIVGIAVTAAVAAFLRFYPKGRAIEDGGKIGDLVGTVISTFGNSKLGKKIWNKVEEGPITTMLAFCMAFITRLGAKMLSDNRDGL